MSESTMATELPNVPLTKTEDCSKPTRLKSRGDQGGIREALGGGDAPTNLGLQVQSALGAQIFTKTCTKQVPKISEVGLHLPASKGTHAYPEELAP